MFCALMTACLFSQTELTRLSNNGSIVQYSPRMTVLILDGCSEFHIHEPSARGRTKMHGLNLPRGEMEMKYKRDTLFSFACAPGHGATDTGYNASETAAFLYSYI